MGAPHNACKNSGLRSGAHPLRPADGGRSCPTHDTPYSIRVTDGDMLDLPRSSRRKRLQLVPHGRLDRHPPGLGDGAAAGSTLARQHHSLLLQRRHPPRRLA